MAGKRGRPPSELTEEMVAEIAEAIYRIDLGDDLPKMIAKDGEEAVRKRSRPYHQRVRVYLAGFKAAGYALQRL